MKVKITPHYERISKLLRNQRQIHLDRAGILLGARYGALDGVCDSCKILLSTYTVCVMKVRFPRQYSTIHILCDTCRYLHRGEVKYYLYLNK